MIKATFYNSKTGQIEMSIEAPDEETVILQSRSKDAAIYWGDAYNWADTYFDRGDPVPRPQMKLYVDPGLSLSAGQELLVRNIPKGCKVTHAGGAVSVDDGFISWSTDEPGEYTFLFQLFPYAEVEVNASVR